MCAWCVTVPEIVNLPGSLAKRNQCLVVGSVLHSIVVLMLRGDVSKMNYVHCRRGILLAWGTMILNEYNVDKYVNKGKGKSIVCRRNREQKQDFSCAQKNSSLTTEGTVPHQQTIDISLS
ncbi:hypothetical protein PHYBLDRAFT_59276 [Phycomyces blakesleeanus NRRL 1555(-)]|uniref:Uncharacterized protein n=1 Tax=Phycomyces blakesleeanus (strain ATCC 8743b / DSM 1359 / FGSC 10004 / NBRC 33097 / NRRL 1555) TaxID=763407 RepID=A0A167QTC5_PHYB8|nr:hypothetical protein PHYBLDRAFT_59276 [Phycomyces blakesleeanus NRRL 1555(-)]OAD80248.1 hypothetical protein PHYBLDRAFT_59276 [Phycomyces blakesleeanus NRRL 1555(-)]|eukprot:XP_018298288.1 hypothetical protein PHYBLDRAFT_59276 [Phycomyces blakesleeanus NRRL 1555(-)]